MGETVTTTERLYDTDEKTGVKFLAYPAGHEVPVEEYKRLTGKKPPKSGPADQGTEPTPPAGGTIGSVPPAGDTPPADTQGSKSAAPTKPLSKQNRAQLEATAAAEGVDIEGLDTNAAIAEAITKHRAAK